MQFIKRLKHTAQSCENAIIGWDIFRSGDYSSIDNAANQNYKNVKVGVKPIYGKTVIFALNLGKFKFFKKWFFKE
jgi:hypothetical protein